MSTPLRADWRASAAALALGTAAVAAALVFAPSVPDQDALYRFGKPGHDDNPTARVDWEIRRLADPATGVIPDGIRERELAFAQILPARRTGDGATWALRGPANLGGRTRALGVDVADPDVLVAGGVSGGMWRSADAGASWTKTSGPLQLQSVTALAQDTRPGRTETWYYGTGEYRGNSAEDPGSPYRGDGLFKSTDNGQSWVPLDATVSGTPQTADPFDYIFELAIDPTNPSQDELYAATWLGIYRSQDGGASWTQTLPASAGATGVAVAGDGRVYAAVDASAAYWRSDDGIAWTDITPADLAGNQNRTVIAVAPSDPDVVYFYGDHAPAYFQPNGQFYRYDAAADMMENRSAAFMASTGGVEHYIQYCIGLEVHPTMPDVVYVAGVDLYRSDDAFATASPAAFLSNGHADNHTFVFDGGTPLQLYVGSDGGVHRTQALFSAGNPGWQERTTGYTTSQFYHLALDPYVAGERLLGGTQDNGSWLARSADPDDWVKLQGGDGAYSAFTATPFQYIVSYQNGDMIRRTYNASGSQIASIDVSAPTSGFQFIHPFSIDPAERRAFYTFTGNDVWRNPDITSANPVSGWSELSNVTGGNISTVTAAAVPANRLWVGTQTGRVYRIDDALSDEPLVLRLDPETFPNGYVNQITAHPTNPDEAIVSFSNYSVVSLWRTVDAGATWESISGNLEENPDGSGAGPSTRGVAILAFEASGPRYFAATSTGLYSTYQLRGDDTVWELEAPDTIGNLVVDAVEARSVDGAVALATHGGGMFSASFVAPPVAGEADATRPSLTVGTPYPNPSAGRATVAVRAGDAGALRVELYDVRGRRLSVLHDGPVAAGATLSLALDGERLPSGRYLVRATAGDAVETAFATVVR